jgi:hypothetical protein
LWPLAQSSYGQGLPPQAGCYKRLVILSFWSKADTYCLRVKMPPKMDVLT